MKTEPLPQKKHAPTSPASASDRVSFVGFLVGLVVLCFVAGCAAREFEWSIYEKLLASPFAGLRAWMDRTESTSSVLDSDLWHRTSHTDRGVVRSDANKFYDGYTLYTSPESPSAFLMDMQGKTVHEWKRPMQDVWSNPPHVVRAVPDSFIHWRRCHMFPNGDLITIYVGVGDSPWGYGLVKFDKDSNVIWDYAANVHHDIDVLQDGSVVTLTHEFRPPQQIPHIYLERAATHVLDDFVVKLTPDGKETAKVSILEAFANSPYHNLLQVLEDFEWDPLHANSVDVIDEEFAARHEFADVGDVLVSLRSRGVLAVIDMETAKVKWASYGPFYRQHDAEALPNGNIMLFDNRGHVGAGGPTRIIELNPISLAVEWSFAGNDSEWLYSRTRGMQQVLPNDNVLITESDGGRILEVTRAGEVVWEFRNPAGADQKQNYIGVVCGAFRFPKDDVRFALNGGAGSHSSSNEKENHAH